MEDLNGDNDKILVFRDGNMEMRPPKANPVISTLSEFSVEQRVWGSLDFKHFFTYRVYLVCASTALIKKLLCFKYFTVLFLKSIKERVLLIALN